jgi:hypothetical protein
VNYPLGSILGKKKAHNYWITVIILKVPISESPATPCKTQVKRKVRCMPWDNWYRKMRKEEWTSKPGSAFQIQALLQSSSQLLIINFW